MRRRRYLALVGTAFVAGCLGNGSESDGSTPEPSASSGNGGSDSGESGSTGNETDTGENSTDSDGNGTDESSNGDTGGQFGFTKRWETKIDAQKLQGSSLDAAAAGDSLFVGSAAGMSAFALSDGSRRWQRDDWTSYADIYASEEILIAFTNGADVIGLDPESGETRWKQSLETQNNIIHPSTVTDQHLVVAASNKTVVFDRKTGDTVATIAESGSDVVATDNTLILSRPFGVSAYDIDSESQNWQSDIEVSPGAAIGDGVLVAPNASMSDETGTVYGIDIGSGEVQWETEIENLSRLSSQIATAGKTAVLLDGSFDSATTLYGLDPQTGSERFTADLGNGGSPFSPPATDQGVAIVQAEDGLRGYDGETGERLDTTDGSFVILHALADNGYFFEITNDIVCYSLFGQ